MLWGANKATLQVKTPRVPDLIADFLLILLLVMRTVTAEENDGDYDEDQEDRNYSGRNDASVVGGCMTQGRQDMEGLKNMLQITGLIL